MPRRARASLIGAAAGALLLIAVWYGAFHVGVLERADQRVFRGFFDLHSHGRIESLASFIAGLCNPIPWVYLAAAAVLVAFLRGRPRVALTAGGILLAANLTTHLLKPLLAAPRAASLLGGAVPPEPASWPSGHATAAMSLALCAVLVSPARLRPLVGALGAAFTIAVSYSFLTLGWHYPSDVFGGFLVAAIWTLLAVAAVFTANAKLPRPARSGLVQRLTVREALGPPSTALLIALGLAAVVAIARPQAVAAYAHDHEAFVIGATAIAALGLALATGLMLALRK
jgi:membrane-associated phospholipid phosphatase